MKSKVLYLVISAILIGIALLIFISQCSHKENQRIPLNVGYMKLGTFSLTFVAIEKGYLTEEGFDVNPVTLPTGQQGLDGLVTGNIDVTNFILLSMCNLEANIPGKIKLIALTYATADGKNDSHRLIVKEGSGINTIADLKGKKIGVPLVITYSVTMKMILQKFFNPDDATIIQIAASDTLAALEGGGIDAALMIDPIATVALLKGGFKEIDSSVRAKYIIDPFYSSAVALSSDFIKKYPDAAQRVQRAYAKAIKFRNENETEYRAIIAKHTGSPALIAQKMCIMNDQLPSDVNMLSLQEMADIFFENKILVKHINMADMLFN